MKLKIKKTDTVKVISGNDKGKVGRVLDVYPDKMRILVEQVNIRAKHEKPSQNNQKGGIVRKEMPIHYSNVMLMDNSSKPTRIGISVKEMNGKTEKTRFARTNNKEI
jgi:large subunit ribosomal protein L24